MLVAIEKYQPEELLMWFPLWHLCHQCFHLTNKSVCQSLFRCVSPDIFTYQESVLKFKGLINILFDTLKEKTVKNSCYVARTKTHSDVKDRQQNFHVFHTALLLATGNEQIVTEVDITTS